MRGENVLPPYLGLPLSDLTDLLRPLDNADPTLLSLLDRQHDRPSRQLRTQLRQLRQDEYVSLYTLLDRYVDATRPFSHQMTAIMTHACLRFSAFMAGFRHAGTSPAQPALRALLSGTV
ncbi:hypothetical protein P4S72_16865 [Vibrio sp. PP-XX7]